MAAPHLQKNAGLEGPPVNPSPVLFGGQHLLHGIFILYFFFINEIASLTRAIPNHLLLEVIIYLKKVETLNIEIPQIRLSAFIHEKEDLLYLKVLAGIAFA